MKCSQRFIEPFATHKYDNSAMAYRCVIVKISLIKLCTIHRKGICIDY